MRDAELDVIGYVTNQLAPSTLKVTRMYCHRVVTTEIQDNDVHRL